MSRVAGWVWLSVPAEAAPQCPLGAMAEGVSGTGGPLPDGLDDGPVRSRRLLAGGLCLSPQEAPWAPGATSTPRRRVPGADRPLLGLALFHSLPSIARSPRGSRRARDTYAVAHAAWRGFPLLTARGLQGVLQPVLSSAS